MISITRVQVPSYLVGGSFFNSLNADDSEEFTVPMGNFKASPAVNSLDDLSHVLHSLQYWGVDIVPTEVVGFLICNLHEPQYKAVTDLLGEFDSQKELLPLVMGLHALQNDQMNMNTWWDFQSKNKALQRLVFCLLSDNPTVCAKVEELFDKVGNFDFHRRSDVFHHIPLLDASISDATPIVNVRNVARSFANSCHDEPCSLFFGSPAVPLLTRLLSWSDDEVVQHTCKALSWVLPADESSSVELLDAQLASRLVQLVSSDVPAVQTAALEAGEHYMNWFLSAQQHIIKLYLEPYLVGQACLHSARHRQILFDLNPLHTLFSLMLSPDKDTCRYASLAMQSFTAGTIEQKQAVIELGLLPRALELSKVWESDKDILAVLICIAGNMGTRSTLAQLQYAIDMGVIAFLCSYLQNEDENVQQCTLSGIRNILVASKEFDAALYTTVKDLITECEGVDALIEVRDEEGEHFEFAGKIIRSHFPDEDEGGFTSSDEEEEEEEDN